MEFACNGKCIWLKAGNEEIYLYRLCKGSATGIALQFVVEK
jgi:hypothetical protein